ncbi:MAG: carbohydrate ABC transporter permease [Christensenellales bacterium]|jgi:putative aldouronate transport system permease protein
MAIVKESMGDRIFKGIVTVLVVLLALTCVLPFINLFAISLSDTRPVTSGEVTFWPIGWNTAAYKAIISNGLLVQSLKFTVLLTILYTAMCLFCTVLLAYPLSRRDLKGRTGVLLYIMFTMYFGGGMIPAYLVVSNLNLINSIWALILPALISTYNMILMKTYFQSLPEALVESAVIDGANDVQILFRVILPLSKPMLATIALFYAVGRWNALTDALLYINDPKMFPLQLRLRQIIAQNQVNQIINDIQEESTNIVTETVKSANVIFSIMPILLVYPFLQKYFVKGVMIGSIKG